MNSNELIELSKSVVMNTYARFPVAFERGEGSRLYDFEGREYIDFSSGIGVNSLGYTDVAWVSAVTEQAKKLAHSSNLYYTEPMVRLAQKLAERTELACTFFSNSGAEANEGMIKLARKYSFDKYGPGREKIVTLINSFHGRTIATLEATGQNKFHNYFFPFTNGFVYAYAGDLSSVIEALRDDSCAVMIELVQGEGGVQPLDKAFVKQLKKLCDERDILLLIDEVQTGVGRCGELFAFQKYGVKPDVFSFAKGIGGGLPLGGFMCGERLRDVLSPGDHAATFGGNPICCAAALSVLEKLDSVLLDEVTKKGEYITKAVKAMKCRRITAVRGLGLMLGIQLTGLNPRDVVEKLLEAGLVCLTAGNDILRLLPPLTISYEELDRGLEIMKNVFEGL